MATTLKNEPNFWLRKIKRNRRKSWWYVYRGPESLVRVPTKERALKYIEKKVAAS